MRYVKKYEELGLGDFFKKKIPMGSPETSETSLSQNRKSLTVLDILKTIDLPNIIESIKEKDESKDYDSYEIKIKDSYMIPILRGTPFQDIFESSYLSITLHSNKYVQAYLKIITTECPNQKLQIGEFKEKNDWFIHRSNTDGITYRYNSINYENGHSIIEYTINSLNSIKDTVKEILDDVKELISENNERVEALKNLAKKREEFNGLSDVIEDCLIDFEDMSVTHDKNPSNGQFMFTYQINGIDVEPISVPGSRNYSSTTVDEAKLNITPELIKVFKAIETCKIRLDRKIKDYQLKTEFKKNKFILKVKLIEPHIPDVRRTTRARPPR